MAIGIAKSELVTQRQLDDSGPVSSSKCFRTESGMIVERCGDVGPLRNEWQALESETDCGIYQTFAWVRGALDTLHQGDTPLILVGRSRGKVDMILPLVISGSWVRTVQWVGESHANIGSGLYSEAFLKRGEKIDAEMLKRFVVGPGTGPVTMLLHNQQPRTAGFPNPLSGFPSVEGVNNFYSMDLSGGFVALLKAGNAKRKKSRFRSRVKQAEAAGGYELVCALDSDEADATIDEFLQLKEQRFKELGISDVFACTKAVSFIRRIARASEENGVNPLMIFLLKIGGKTRAVFAGGKKGRTVNGQLNAISVDELSRIGPGEMLLHMVAEKLANEGFQSLDLGIGNERYKVSWCQHEIKTHSTIVALNTAAVPFAAASRLIHTIKRMIRNNPSAWNAVKSLRRKKSAIFTPRDC